MLNIIHHNVRVFFTHGGKKYLEENIQVSTVFMPTSFPFCVQLVFITLVDFVIHEHSPTSFSFFTFTPNRVREVSDEIAEFARCRSVADPIGSRVAGQPDRPT